MDMQVACLFIKAAMFLFQHHRNRRRKIAVHSGGKPFFYRFQIRCRQNPKSAVRKQGKLLSFCNDVDDVSPISPISMLAYSSVSSIPAMRT